MPAFERNVAGDRLEDLLLDLLQKLRRQVVQLARERRNELALATLQALDIDDVLAAVGRPLKLRHLGRREAHRRDN